MLLVTDPETEVLHQIISDLFEEKIAREAVLAWQQAVIAEYGWDISVPEDRGYWYFYSLAFVDVRFPGGYFLRSSDLAEYLVDMDGIPGDAIVDDVMHLRSHQIDASALRWPLAVINDDGLMQQLPGVRGTFERRLDMVEHCHMRYEGNDYLLVKDFDERAGQLLLLGSSREPERASALMQALAVTDYMFP